MQNLNSGHNARDAWAAFNGLYQRAARLPTDPNRPPLGKPAQKREQKQLRGRVHDDWERIRADHPDNHVELKLALGNAIRRTTIAGRLVDRALSEITQGISDSAEVYETLLSTEVRALATMNDLVTVARRVGRAAEFIMAHANRETALWKRNIKHSGEQVASRRREEEGDFIGTTHRRDMFQANTKPISLPGGRQWRILLAHGPLSMVGLCLSGDEHNRIVDRFVMKDMWFTNHPNLWNDPGFWMGSLDDPTSKVPCEVQIMGRLTATEQYNILRMRSWHMAPEKLMFRVGLEHPS